MQSSRLLLQSSDLAFLLLQMRKRDVAVSCFYNNVMQTSLMIAGAHSRVSNWKLCLSRHKNMCTNYFKHWKRWKMRTKGRREEGEEKDHEEHEEEQEGGAWGEWGKPSKKKYGIIWEFFPNVRPHPPLLGTLRSKWNFLGDFVKNLVCVFGDFRVI